MSDQWGTHACRAPGCQVLISRTKLLCPGHWARVPKALRDRLSDVFYRWQQGDMPEDFGRQILREVAEAEQACVESLVL